MKKSRIVKLKQLEHVQNEIQILSRTRSTFVVNLKAVFQDDNSVYLLSEYIPGGELFSHLRRRHKFDFAVYQFFSVEVICALEYLHSLNIVFRDLKPENILLNKNGHIRLVEFSLSKVVSNRTFTLCGTPEYLSPEQILGSGYGSSTDWWALGILIYEMALGYPPFFGRNPFTVYKKILEGNVKFFEVVPKLTKNVISSFLIADRKSRLGCSGGSVGDIKHHTFFRGIDWVSAVQELMVPPIAPVLNGDGDSSNFDYYPEETLEEPNNLTSDERRMFQAIDHILERISMT
jgi:serine/threonine protein kinase